MIFEAKEIILKNGIKAILKTPEITDAETFLNNIRTASGETDYLTRYAEEWESFTVEDEEKWISDNRKSKNNLVIACYIDGKAVGSCDITFFGDMKTSHRAGIGIAIIESYWNMGIGSAMFSELIKFAKEHKGTEILELEYLEGNERGKALYEKFGFKTVCVKPKICKLKDGTYQDLFYMQKEI
ncbi:MAG: GNAT family N-acetyltransferase [Clostridia bacterium]|nr:GNAT family N-acetyltransferase [Clostridia bacterium]MBQ7118235.1 GNAT family N-acetyltransferase [Clostridia bacterium]